MLCYRVFKFDQDLVPASIRLFFCSEEFASTLAIFLVVDVPFGGRGMLVGVNGNFRQAHALKLACERFCVNKMSMQQTAKVHFCCNLLTIMVLLPGLEPRSTV